MGGEKDPEVVAQLQNAKKNFEDKLTVLGEELQGYWAVWDTAIARAANTNTNDVERVKVRNQMVDLLNRRSYIRNLVRDVNAVLNEKAAEQ